MWWSSSGSLLSPVRGGSGWFLFSSVLFFGGCWSGLVWSGLFCFEVERMFFFVLGEDSCVFHLAFWSLEMMVSGDHPPEV